MKFDCNKECRYCPITLCEKRGNYTQGEATSELSNSNEVKGLINSDTKCARQISLKTFNNYSLLNHKRLNIMESKAANVTFNVTLEEAKEWYVSDNGALKELALKAFPEKELQCIQFNEIKTFEDAVIALGLNMDWAISILAEIEIVSKASAAIFQLNIIREALNLGEDLHLTKNPEDSYIYYPYIPFIAKGSSYFIKERNSGEMELLGKIKYEEQEYFVLSGYTRIGGNAGLSSFDSSNGVGHTSADFGFFGCAKKEIAQHFGKYFGMLITEAKYGDLPGFQITSANNLTHRRL